MDQEVAPSGKLKRTLRVDHRGFLSAEVPAKPFLGNNQALKSTCLPNVPPGQALAIPLCYKAAPALGRRQRSDTMG